MKNKFFGLLLIVVGGLIMSITGCPTSTDGEKEERNTDPKTVKITGIVGVSGNVQIMVAKNKPTQPLSNYTPENVAVETSTVQNGTLEVSLTVPDRNFYTTNTPWTGNGKYYVLFNPTSSGSDGRVYTGSSGTEPVQVDFNEAVKSLDFSMFTIFQ